jgi:hypothetical protein
MRRSTTTLLVVTAILGLWMTGCAPDLVLLSDESDGETHSQADGVSPDGSPDDSAEYVDVSSVEDVDGSSLPDVDGSSLQDGDGSSLEDGDGSSLEDGDGSSLEDGDGSSLQDVDGSSVEEVDGSFAPETAEAGQACENNGECPTEPCALGICVSGFCQKQTLPEGAACDDGEACNGIETCAGGDCLPGLPIVCNDGEACNGVETCVDGNCQALAPMDCNDGDACNGIETCANSSCVSGVPLNCDDGESCNGQETCESGQCAAGTPLPCAVGTVCGGLGSCENGQCLLGPPLDCDDDNICTTDSCELGLCEHQSVPGCCNTDQGCADGDACNGDEACVEHQCVAGAPFDCSDGNPCTVDTCEDGLCLGPSTPKECFCDHTEAPTCATLPMHRFGKNYADDDLDTMFSPSPNGGLTGYQWQGLFFELFQTQGMPDWVPIYQSFASAPLNDHLQGFVEVDGLFGYEGDVLLGYCSPTQQVWAPYKLTVHWSETYTDHSLFAADHTTEPFFIALLEYTAGDSCWVPWVCTADCDQ